MNRIHWAYFGWRVMLLVAGMLITACAPWQPAPSRVSAPHWSLEVPNGWMRLRTPEYEMFSKDGPYLQFILIQTRSLDQPFRFTRQRLASDLLPHEAAQVIISNLRSDPQIKNFTLVSNTPAALGAEIGFRLEYTYIDPQGVENRGIYYGVRMTDVFVNLQYTAAKRYYFNKDAPAFEQVRQSVRLFSGTTPG
jgi:hypothetical protein